MRAFSLLLLCWLLAIPALAQEQPAPLPVVASFSILGDLVRQVGGDAVAVTTLVGPNSDTHTYEPTPDNAKAIAGAKLVFMNGLGFESWMPKLVTASGYRGRVVTVSDGIKPRTMVDEDEGGKTIADPHAWQDISNARHYLQAIAAALSAALPDQATAIAARVAAYDAQLQAEDRTVRAALAAIPAKQRVIVTSHDAFGYFGAAYGIRFLAPEGVSTEAEPSAQGIARLNRQVKTLGVKVLFFENMSNPRLIQQIARDTGTTVGGRLYADALSPADGPAATYLAMVKENLRLMLPALQ